MCVRQSVDGYIPAPSADQCLGAMTDKLSVLVAFLTDVERLKLVKRKAYVSDLSRRENSAEHSWHLALGLVAIAQELGLKIDLHKALVMALIHDTCEIDAGDTPAFGPQRPDQHEAELRCFQRLAAYDLKFASLLRSLPHDRGAPADCKIQAVI
jgi:5'-deoxynucleotidase YfbR-like HD superfamily hydrolase